MKEKKPLEGFDINKYTLEEPSGDMAHNEDAWKKCIDAAKIQLEYQKDKWVVFHGGYKQNGELAAARAVWQECV